MSSSISFVCSSSSTIAGTLPSGSRRFAQSIRVRAPLPTAVVRVRLRLREISFRFDLERLSRLVEESLCIVVREARLACPCLELLDVALNEVAAVRECQLILLGRSGCYSLAVPSVDTQIQPLIDTANPTIN
jgi:hypothetical protein